VIQEATALLRFPFEIVRHLVAEGARLELAESLLPGLESSRPRTAGFGTCCGYTLYSLLTVRASFRPVSSTVGDAPSAKSCFALGVSARHP